MNPLHSWWLSHGGWEADIASGKGNSPSKSPATRSLYNEYMNGWCKDRLCKELWTCRCRGCCISRWKGSVNHLCNSYCRQNSKLKSTFANREDDLSRVARVMADGEAAQTAPDTAAAPAPERPSLRGCLANGKWDMGWTAENTHFWRKMTKVTLNLIKMWHSWRVTSKTPKAWETRYGQDVQNISKLFIFIFHIFHVLKIERRYLFSRRTQTIHVDRGQRSDDLIRIHTQFKTRHEMDMLARHSWSLCWAKCAAEVDRWAASSVFCRADESCLCLQPWFHQARLCPDENESSWPPADKFQYDMYVFGQHDDDDDDDDDDDTAEWCMMYDVWWMMNDEWWMMNDECWCHHSGNIFRIYLE